MQEIQEIIFYGMQAVFVYLLQYVLCRMIVRIAGLFCRYELHVNGELLFVFVCTLYM